MIKLIATAALGALVGTTAIAESTTMSKPIQAGSLHEGPLDMVAYWVPLEDEGFELTATFLGRVEGDAPMRIVMKLANGDDVAFAMPGYRTALYRFERAGDVVDASVELTGGHFASR
jgi:hypothetical protein